jgi:hypothetical protein
MSEYLKEKRDRLIKTIEGFVETANRMLENGEINKSEYDNMTKNKLEFLHSNKVIKFPTKDIEVPKAEKATVKATFMVDIEIDVEGEGINQDSVVDIIESNLIAMNFNPSCVEIINFNMTKREEV